MSVRDRYTRLKEVQKCKEELLAVLSKYPGIEVGWSCDEDTDTFGINELWIVVEDGGWNELPLYEE